MPGLERDLAGLRFGSLLVKCAVKGKRSVWLCVCDCGNEKPYQACYLVGGRVKTCGCGKIRDLTGQTFGELTVIKRLDKVTARGVQKYNCLCSCGKTAVRAQHSLLTSLYSHRCDTCNAQHTQMCNKEYNTKPDQLSEKKRKYRSYKDGALQRGLPFELDFIQFLDLTSKPCHYCGALPSNVSASAHGSGNFVYNGIDRKNNSKGYTIDNSVTCCKKCNYAKGPNDIDDFESWILRAANHIKERNLENV